MASVNMPPGAVDPFSGSPAAAPVRYAAFDSEQFSLHSNNSPSSARRALEAHMKDTDRRIQDASKLGQTLIQQRRELAAKLKEVEQLQQDAELPTELQGRLSELEREYNEIGRDSARAFLPKSRVTSESEGMQSPAVISGSGRESPTKLSMPSRRQRNQPTNRVHDIEFATEISTSLLAQVRQLQAALAEKDDILKDTQAVKAQLESESASLWQRLRHMDENEQKYKDENWTLETRLQDLEANFKQSADKESRLAQLLKSAQSDKAAKERELDELRLSHEKLSEEHANARKMAESDLSGLRKGADLWQIEREKLEQRVKELTNQNTELAKAVSFRMSQHFQPSDADFMSAEENVNSDDASPEHSAPASPVKGTPARHGMLESETLKSSLNHAHRMIQNLKNNIHREKTEKIELKRMLQDARDELEQRRDNTGIAANVAKKRRSEPEGVKFKKPTNNKLGAARSSTVEIIDEPDWEDQDGEQTPSKARHGVVSRSMVAGAAAATAYDRAYGRSDGDATDAFETANETDTGFETATERGGTTESEAFATGAEDLGDDTEGDATETEASSTRKLRPKLSNVSSKRMSYMSTASTSGDEDEDEAVRTPVYATQQPKYRLRLSRGARRSGRVGDIIANSPQTSQASPTSSSGTPQPANMQSLGDELDGLDDDSLEGTPASTRDAFFDGTPVTQRYASEEPGTPTQMDDDERAGVDPTIRSPFTRSQSQVATHELAVAATKPMMVDAGVMTEPWRPEPEPITGGNTVRDAAGGLIAGALAGLGVSRLAGPSDEVLPNDDQQRHASLPAEPAPVVQTVSIGTDARGAPVSISTGADARVIPTSTTGTDARAPVQTISIGTDAPVTPHAANVGMETGADPERALADIDDLPLSSMDHSPIISQETEPEMWPLPPTQRLVSSASNVDQSLGNAFDRPPMPAIASPPAPVQLNFSEVVSQEFEPVIPEADTPILPRRSSRRADLLYDEEEGDDGSHIPSAAAGFVAGAATPALLRRRLSQDQQPPLPTVDRRDAAVVQDAAQEKVPFGAAAADAYLRQPLSDLSPNLPPSRPAPAPPVHEGSQTVMSGNEIDSMVRNKNVTVVAPALRDAGNSPFRDALDTGVVAGLGIGSPTKNGRQSIDNRPSIYESPTLKATKRPSSAGSMRKREGHIGAPPLPPDHSLKIAAAQHAPTTPNAASSAGTMGPPVMPASAYKRPNTPGDRQYHSRGIHSRDSTTPRPMRVKDSRSQVAASQSDRLSHRTSVSSFASELDERFNISRGGIMYPMDIEPATDPRMIQAITQTMIGEYLWKYTRKAGRSETSTTRHRRFFWVHPYTRTLYWSEQDPSTAGKNMMKAKSVAIEAVRVISDDNAYPPGLHRKSLVVITPGREIVFTAPTGQRHETWFNALTYLLMRTEREKGEADDDMDQDDIEEFNPRGISGTVRRSINKMAGGATQGRSTSRQSRRTSLSSYNSRTTRDTSAQRHDATLTQRQSAATSQPRLHPAPAHGNLTATMSQESRASSGSVQGRFSSMASRFRPSSRNGAHSAQSMRPSDPAGIYDASVIGDSAEDLRAVIEQQERDADRLENVRACCDGKHDVGSLKNRTGKSRFGSHGHSHGHHSHHGTTSSRA